VQTYTSLIWYHAEYATFQLDSETNGYKLHVSGYSGDAGDSLSNVTISQVQQQNGMKFSTYDVDHDKQVLGSCAKSLNGSWWFSSCYYSCLTCPYGSDTFIWYSLDTYGLENMGNLRSARMMI